MIWSKTSAYDMRNLKYLGGSTTVERLWKWVVKDGGWVWMIHPYNPIINIKRSSKTVTFETLTEEYPKKEEWSEKLLKRYPRIKEELPVDTRVYFGKGLVPLSAEKGGEPLNAEEMSTLAKEANLDLNYHMLTVKTLVSKALRVFTADLELDQQRMAVYLPGETPFHISKYALPELIVAGLESYLYELAAVELEHVEKIFWYSIRSTSKEWFKMTEGLDISKQDMSKVQQLATTILGL